MSQKKFKQVDKTYFVPVGEFLNSIFEGGSHTIAGGYADNEGAIKDNTSNSGQVGRYVEYVQARDLHGRDKGKRFRFDDNLRRLMTRPSDTDIYGRKQYDFLKNHPECEGSPNGIYESDGKGGWIQTGISFRELNEAKDAKVALDAERLTTKAKSVAYDLDEETLSEIANIIGYYGPVDDVMRLRVVEWAGVKPTEFNELLESGDRSTRALIRKALQDNVLYEKGKMIMWENHVLGADEDAAVSSLVKDKKVADSLREALGYSPVEEKKPVKPKPPGKPSKVQTEKKKEEQLSGTPSL